MATLSRKLSRFSSRTSFAERVANPTNSDAYTYLRQDDALQNRDGIDSESHEDSVHLANLEEQEVTILEELKTLDEFWELRRLPVTEKLTSLRAQIQRKKEELAFKEHQKSMEMPPASGPACFVFVDSGWFNAVCTSVIILNVFTMLFEAHMTPITVLVLDQVYLAWYVFELGVKFMYHRCDLFYGKTSVVWWNYLDASIVASGILDQWVGACLRAVGVLHGASSDIAHNFVRCLRFLRLFRLLRLLRLVKAILSSDLSFTATYEFDLAMALVIAVNSVVMGAELDFPSTNWIYLEHVFLLVYLFELIASMKRCGIRLFFTHAELQKWHVLDFSIVSGGVLDLWVVPLVGVVQVLMGHPSQAGTGVGSSVVKLLRMMRLLRVLRLVKLFKTVPPLYRLMMGVAEALDSMKWVMVLTVLILYACAVVFCTTATKGVLFEEGHVPETVMRKFGTMTNSMFSLFNLMNGDTSAVEGMINPLAGKVLFICFVVISNWAMLAILTSVVSDHMIQASTRIAEEEEADMQEREKNRKREVTLRAFEEVDRSGHGSISKSEWEAIWADQGLQRVLVESAGLGAEEVEDLYSFCARIHKGFLPYHEFVEIIQDHSKNADMRCIVKILGYLQDMTQLMNNRFKEQRQLIDKLFESMDQKLGQSPKRFHAFPARSNDTIGDASYASLESSPFTHGSPAASAKTVNTVGISNWAIEQMRKSTSHPRSGSSLSDGAKDAMQHPLACSRPVGKKYTWMSLVNVQNLIQENQQEFGNGQSLGRSDAAMLARTSPIQL